MESEFTVCGVKYRILRLLGHGKGGYSYLAENGGRLAVIKQIHHEPCSYFTFGNKIESERRDHGRLEAAGIRIPKLFAVDTEAERVVKEFIDGPTVAELIAEGRSVAQYLPDVRDMAAKAKAAGFNIDYYPTNFVVRDGLLWYVDYECSEYSDEWNFENWGLGHWSDPNEFRASPESGGGN